MEIDCGSFKLTTFNRNLLTYAGGEASLAALLVSALVKAQLDGLTQEYMKLLENQPKLIGDHQASRLSKPVDAGEDDDDDGDGDGDEDEEDNDRDEDKSPVEGNKSGPENGAGRGVEENGEEDDEQENGEDSNEDEDDDDDDDDDDDEDEVGGGGEEEEEEEEEEEDEDEDDEEEALPPPKKRKK